MGDKFNKFFVIVFFPITFLLCILKYLWHMIDLGITKKMIEKIDIEKIDSLDGLSFEEFLYYSFKSRRIKVEKTKSSRDYGADLIIYLDGYKIVIQSKLYYNHNVGNSAIQEVASARNYYNADGGIVITNSYFTKSAIILAEKTNVKLIDRKNLCEFLKNINKHELCI